MCLKLTASFTYTGTYGAPVKSLPCSPEQIFFMSCTNQTNSQKPIMSQSTYEVTLQKKTCNFHYCTQKQNR